MIKPNVIRAAMALQGMKTADLAKRCGVSPQRMSVILNSQEVRPETLERIASVLGVDMEMFIDGEG